MLYNQIKAVDPNWRFDELEPLEAMDAQGRANTIKDLLMERAKVYYKIRGDIGPLQVETLRFLQGAVDREYEEAVIKYNSSKLPVHLSREETIGNYIDAKVRQSLK